MGQTAVLSCLDENNFRRLAANPESFKYYEVALASEGFNKTFEGLRFVLSKGQPEDVVELITQLFEPSTFVGEEIDYEQIDWENLSPDVPLDGTAVYYHSPATVQALSTHIASVRDEDFRKAFDPDELNREDIYPGGVWNREVGENQGFNEQDLVEELHRLQQFLSITSEGGHYCICYVG